MSLCGPQMLTRRQAATALSVSTDTVDRLIARGDLTAVRIGRQVRIPVASLEAMVLPQGEYEMGLIVSAGGVTPGQYPATFKGWQQKSNVYGPGLTFEWQITSGDHAGQKAGCMQPMPSTGNKCGRLLAKMFARPLKANEDIEATLNGLIGRPFMVTVEQSKSGASVVTDAIPIPTA